MNAFYGLYTDPEGAQRAVDSLRAASSELKFDARQIVIVSGEPHEGYEFTDSHTTSSPYRWLKDARYSISEVTPDRWDCALYYDHDRSVPDKTYSEIGGWVREFTWDPLKWRMPIPPRVADAMDLSQRWAIACTRDRGT